jgi:enediyne biosynthesis protein E4
MIAIRNLSFFFLVTLFLPACKKENRLFAIVPASKSNINFTNQLQEKEHFNILYYLYFYNGGGVAAGDVNNDGLIDLYFTANSKAANKLYLNKGNMQFEDITTKAGVQCNSDWSSGVTMADVNADGWLDIYVCAVSGYFGLKGHNQLFINNKNGSFTEQSAAYGLNFSGLSTQAAFFDFDHDGDLDCYLLNQSKQPHANITDTSNRRKKNTLAGDCFFRNNLNVGKNTFTDVSETTGIYQSSLGYGLGLSVADFNNDGWDDIYIGNDFHENDYYYLNNKNGTFTEAGAQHFGHYSRFSMGNDAADFNNDGHIDLISVDMLPPDEKTLKTYGSDENPDIYKVKLGLNGYQDQYSRNCLQYNNGNGESFSDIALMAGVSATDWSWCPLFADFDNDGKKDLFISSGIVKRPVDLDYVRFISDMQMKKGLDNTDAYDAEAIKAMPNGSSKPFLFKNKGAMQFEEVSDKWGTGDLKGYYNGAAYADLDNDGDLDLVINPINEKAIVLQNQSRNKNYITVMLKDSGLNTHAAGAKVYLFNNIGLQYQHVMATRGFQSSSSTSLHFGIDSSNQVDSLLIVWPDQQYQVIRRPAINQKLEIKKQTGIDSFIHARFFKPQKDLLVNVSANIDCNWKHQENDFVDFNVQYLIPHAQSTRGPKLAVADVNGDGLDDFYACGAKGQPGAIMQQTKGNKFVSTNQQIFIEDAPCEDVDAVFFDADGNGTQDLLVISGGNQLPKQSSELADRLYLNNGNGQFTKAINPFSVQYEAKSCITTADVDKDGDIDFFVGNLASPTAFGLPKTSYLYLNDGKAKFSLASSSVINLLNIGNVTTSCFADINNDSWPDLIVTGEWMPIKIYLNERGKFKSSDLNASTGLWQTLLVSDVNNDGFLDLLVGNWGYNSKLWERKKSPLKMYVKDFDNNGKTEQIVAYNIDGKEYPFLAKDELERPLPVLKKAYLTYSEVAGQTVDYIFYDLFKNYLELKAEQLASGVFINDSKGNFNWRPLPNDFQLAPIMSFVQLSSSQSWMAGGNFYGTIPFEGRYDALMPTAFSTGLTQQKLTGTLPWLRGEVRDMKWIKMQGGKKVLAVARNNQHLVFIAESAIPSLQ